MPKAGPRLLGVKVSTTTCSGTFDVMAAWKAQFDRMLRALARLEKGGSVDSGQEDDLYSFFQNCWHLKDWIKNDDALPKPLRDAIVQEAETLESLQFCADLANGSKHLKLKRARKGATLWFAESLRTVDGKTGEVLSEVPIGYVIASKHGTPKPYDIIEFAKRSVNDWVSVLHKHGLPTS